MNVKSCDDFSQFAVQELCSSGSPGSMSGSENKIIAAKLDYNQFRNVKEIMMKINVKSLFIGILSVILIFV